METSCEYQRIENFHSHRSSRWVLTGDGWRFVPVCDHQNQDRDHPMTETRSNRAVDQDSHPSTDTINQRNQSSYNLQQSATTSSLESTERNHSSEQEILNGISPLEDEDEDEELSDDFDSIFNSDEVFFMQELTMEELILERYNRGLSRNTIERHLKTRTYTRSKDHENLKDHEVCVVCLGEYENDEIVGTLQCGHEYHANCIETWLLEKNNCPVCRAPAMVDQEFSSRLRELNSYLGDRNM